MERTYNFLKNVFPDIKQESKAHPAFLLLLISLLSVPLSYATISLSLAALVLFTLIRFRNNSFHTEIALLLPIVLFALMALSLIWTIDFDRSLRALQKGLPLLVVPLCFMMFPALSGRQKYKIMDYFSLGLLLFVVFWLGKALVRFAMTGNSVVFFYHELVTEDVNAIHVSIYIAIAFMHLMTKANKLILDKFAIALLSVFLVLLSSKNIIVVFVLLASIYGFGQLRSGQRTKSMKWIIGGVLLVAIASVGKIRERFAVEMQSGHSLNQEISVREGGDVYNVSVRQAWAQERFSGNDFFPGTAFRVYQFRIFTEMLQEDNIFFTGYGLNAASQKIKDKGLELGVYTGNGHNEGYLDKNFHNQYVQLFAELGILGLLVLIAILGINLKNGVQSKDFVHISFAILMISLFLTESFLSRQRGIVFFTIIYCLFNSKPAPSVTQHQE